MENFKKNNIDRQKKIKGTDPKKISMNTTTAAIYWLAATSTGGGWTGPQPSDIITAQAIMVTILECWASALAVVFVLSICWGITKKLWTH